MNLFYYLLFNCKSDQKVISSKCMKKHQIQIAKFRYTINALNIYIFRFKKKLCLVWSKKASICFTGFFFNESFSEYRIHLD